MGCAAGRSVLRQGVKRVTIKIYVMNHRKFDFAFGGGVVNPFIIGEDDLSGDTINERQHLLGERCHYWVWKNAPQSEYVGFQIRRRVFLYQPMIGPQHPMEGLSNEMHANPMQQVANVSVVQFVEYLQNIPQSQYGWEWVKNWDVIVPRPLILNQTLAEHYRDKHRAIDWEIFSVLLRKRGLDDGRLPFLTAFHSFIMRWELFERHMQDYWEIIQEAEGLICLPPSGDERRAFGFLTERWFTVWLHRLRCREPQLRVLTLPVLFAEAA
jgi:hypothetical protein